LSFFLNERMKVDVFCHICNFIKIFLLFGVTQTRECYVRCINLTPVSHIESNTRVTHMYNRVGNQFTNTRPRFRYPKWRDCYDLAFLNGYHLALIIKLSLTYMYLLKDSIQFYKDLSSFPTHMCLLKGPIQFYKTFPLFLDICVS